IVKDEFGVQPAGKLGGTLSEAWVDRIAIVDCPETVKQAIGIELHVAARRDTTEAIERAFLVQPARDARGNIGPVILLTQARNVAQDRNAPGLFREVRTPDHFSGAQSRRRRTHVGKVSREPQAAKGNLKPDNIALRG